MLPLQANIILQKEDDKTHIVMPFQTSSTDRSMSVTIFLIHFDFDLLGSLGLELGGESSSLHLPLLLCYLGFGW